MSDDVVYEKWENGVKMSALDTQVAGSHYKKYVIQPVEFIVKNDIAFLEANIIKYAVRHRDKNGVEDLRKVIHYALIAMEMYYGCTE